RNGPAVELTDTKTGHNLLNEPFNPRGSLKLVGSDEDDSLTVLSDGLAGLALSFAGRGGSDLVNVEMSTKNQQPPPQQSGQLKLSLDGGDGIDTFQISTTDFPELVEVLGVPVEEKPDPL